MEVVLINQFFWPDSAPTAHILTDLANHLAERGCSVTVFCGSGSYEKVGRPQRCSISPGIRIFRCPTLPFGRNVPLRLLSYATFLGGAIVLGLFGRRPDLVVTLSTPPLLGIIGTVLKSLTGCRHYTWEMDLYPEVGIDLGVFSSRSTLIRGLARISFLIRNRADGVLALGPCMRKRLIDSGVDPGKISVIENWANGEAIYPAGTHAPGDPFVVHYSGNLGMAHDVDTIQAAIDDLHGDSRFQFVFVGAGQKRPSLEQFCSSRGFAHVSFHPYCDETELARNFSWGDVGLVTQHKDCFGSVVPSKVYAYMAAGTPILYVGPPGTTPAQIIERHRCGWQIECGDSAGLRALLEALSWDPDRVRQAGRNARTAFLECYDLPIGVAGISAALQLCQSPEPQPAVGVTIAAHRK